MDEFIEIPFGANDSELKGWEYTIPDDMEAEIKDGKIIVRQKENKDEKIRKDILALVKKHAVNHERCQMEAYLEKQKEPEDKGEISDGYHTFNQLYYYRMLYNAAFFNLLPKELVHKSKRHHDGEECFGGGWFIVMANLPTGQISNHYELKYWDLFQIPEKDHADEWDGHTPQEAAERIHKYLLETQKELQLVESYVYLDLALDILQRTLGQVDGYQSDNGIAEHKAAIQAVKDAINAKPVEWNDEDEKMLHTVIADINYAQKNFSDSKLVPYGKKVDWLRAFRERSKSFEFQPKQEWSTEDEKNWKAVLEYVKDDALRVWLEKQKEQKPSIFPPGLGEVHFNPVSCKPEEQTHYWKPTKTDVDLFNKAVTTNKALTPTERAQLDIIRFKFGCCRAVNCGGIEQKPVELSEYEKINKCLLDFIKKNSATPFTLYEQFTPQQYIAYLEKQKERGPLTKDEEYTLQRIIEQLEDEGCPQSWKDLLYDIYNLPYDKQEKQEPTEWSKEDEEMINALIRNQEILIDSASNQQLRDTYSKEIQWLKSRRPQPNQEWSKEDEEHYHFVLDGLSYAHADMDRVGSLDRAKLVVMGCEWFKRRIKSLRPQSHQSRWKPSKEQMDALLQAVDDLQGKSYWGYINEVVFDIKTKLM